MNPSRVVTAEELEDGSVLKKAVADFQKEQNQENFMEIMELLRDSFVWVPCNVVLSDQDQEKWGKVISEHEDDPDELIGTMLTNDDVIRMVPDILQNGEECFFPIFSSAEEMGEYGENISIVQKHMLEVIPLARNNEKDDTLGDSYQHHQALLQQ